MKSPTRCFCVSIFVFEELVLGVVYNILKLTLVLFLVQDNKDLYAEEAAVQREKERQRMLSIPGLIAPNEIQDEMVDS